MISLTLPLEGFLRLGLIFARVSILIAAIPLMGARSVPVRIKAGLALAVAVVLFPTVPPLPPGFMSEPAAVVVGLLGEVLVGAALGLMVRAVFAGIELSGTLMGFNMGFGIVSAIDPQNNAQVSLVGQLQMLFAFLLFLATNAHHEFLRLVGHSFKSLPLLGAGLSSGIAGDLVQAGGEIFRLGLKLSAPVVAAIFLANVVLGVVARTVPQINLLIVGFPITIALGLVVLGATLPFFGPVVEAALMGALRDSMAILESASVSR